MIHPVSGCMTVHQQAALHGITSLLEDINEDIAVNSKTFQNSHRILFNHLSSPKTINENTPIGPLTYVQILPLETIRHAQ